MSEGDGETDRTVAILLAGAAAVVVLPALIPNVRAATTTWLLEHRVLVVPGQALLELPFLGAGVDFRRLVIVLVLGALVFTASRRRSERQPLKKGASRG